MAFNPLPQTWIPNWTSDGTNITVPIASFPQMTAAEASTSTGDIRKVMFAIVDQLVNAYNAKALADRPAKMIPYRTSTTDNITGEVTNTYVQTFKLTVSAIAVEPE